METNEKKKVSILMRYDGENISQRFSPKLSYDNISDYVECLMANFHETYAKVMNGIDVLRPVTKEEQDTHIYVFKTDDKTDNEHKLYNVRKTLYDNTVALFNHLLSTAFADIIYIDQCREYQQEQAFKGNGDYLKEVEAVTKEVRENYDAMLSSLLALYNDGEIGKKAREALSEIQADAEGDDFTTDIVA